MQLASKVAVFCNVPDDRFGEKNVRVVRLEHAELREKPFGERWSRRKRCLVLLVPVRRVLRFGALVPLLVIVQIVVDRITFVGGLVSFLFLLNIVLGGILFESRLKVFFYLEHGIDLQFGLDALLEGKIWKLEEFKVLNLLGSEFEAETKLLGEIKSCHSGSPDGSPSVLKRRQRSMNFFTQLLP